MIGRGTRTCEDLFGPGIDKTQFLIFDYGGNFDFFRVDKKEAEASIGRSQTEKIFAIKAEMIRALENLDYQTDELIAYRTQLVNEWRDEVCQLDDNSIRVKQRLRAVRKFRNPEIWHSLTAIAVDELKRQLAPIIPSIQDNELAKRFDYTIYSIEFAKLADQNDTRYIKQVMDTVKDLAKKGTIRAVQDQKEIIAKAKDEAFWQTATIPEMEEIRLLLRNLVQFADKKITKEYYSHFDDEIIDVKEDFAPLLDVNALDDYREKVEHFLKETDDMVVYKLRHNRTLTKQNVDALEKILWEELGTKEQYIQEFGDQSVTRLVRRIVGIEPQEVNDVFSEFLSSSQLNRDQITFVKKIIEYVVNNGYLEKDKLTQVPFKTVGSITELFTDEQKDIREKLLETVDQINRNTEFIS